MALPSSGAISFNNLNTERGLSGTTQTDLNNNAVRVMLSNFSNPRYTGAISMSDGYSKSFNTNSWSPVGSEDKIYDWYGEDAGNDFKGLWGALNTIVSSAIDAPNGGTLGGYCIATGATSLIYLNVGFTSAPSSVICSVYAATNNTDYFTLNCFWDIGPEYNTNFYIDDGTNPRFTWDTAGAGMQRAANAGPGNGVWYRCWQTIPNPSNRTSLWFRIWPARRNDGVNRDGYSCYFWKAQVNTSTLQNVKTIP